MHPNWQNFKLWTYSTGLELLNCSTHIPMLTSSILNNCQQVKIYVYMNFFFCLDSHKGPSPLDRMVPNNGESCTFNITWRRRERKKREKLVYFTKGNLPSVYVSQTRKLCTLQCQMRWYNQAHWHRVDNLLLAIPVNPIPTGKIECQKLVISQKGFRNHIKEFIMYDRKLHKVFWWILLIGKIVSSLVAFSRIIVIEIEVIVKGNSAVWCGF